MSQFAVIAMTSVNMQFLSSTSNAHTEKKIYYVSWHKMEAELKALFLRAPLNT